MTAKREWIILHCIDAYRDASGQWNPKNPHKVPLQGYDSLMTKAEALAALHEVEAKRPDEDFSIRRLGDVVDLKR